MPKITSQTMDVPGSSFQFSAVKPEDLAEVANEFTLATIITDVSGSVGPFAKDLLEAVKTVVKACQKSPRSENLMVRFVTFNYSLFEVHGFKLLADINPDDYQDLACGGSTALFDACYSSVGATVAYSEKLIANDFTVNGCVYVITDGDNNSGASTAKMVREVIESSKKAEKIESLQTFLIGINTKGADGTGRTLKDVLEQFANDAGFTAFIDAGDATAQRLAKLGGWVSKSVSSQSQALGSGGPSAPVALAF